MRQLWHGQRLDDLIKRYRAMPSGPEKEELLKQLSSEDNQVLMHRLGLLGAGVGATELGVFGAQKAVEKGMPYAAAALGRPFDERTEEQRKADENKSRHERIRSMLGGMGLNPDEGVGASIIERFMQNPEDTDKLTAAELANIAGSPLTAATAAIPAMALTRPALERLVGAQTFYHGTNPTAAEGILQTGLDPNFGGGATGVTAKLHAKHQEYAQMMEELKSGKFGPEIAEAVQNMKPEDRLMNVVETAYANRGASGAYPSKEKMTELGRRIAAESARIRSESAGRPGVSWATRMAEDDKAVEDRARQIMMEVDPAMKDVPAPVFADDPRYWLNERYKQQGHAGGTTTSSGHYAPAFDVYDTLYRKAEDGKYRSVDPIKMPLMGSASRIEQLADGKPPPATTPIDASRFLGNAKGRVYTGPGTSGAALAATYAYNPEFGGESLPDILEQNLKKRVGDLEKASPHQVGLAVWPSIYETAKGVLNPEQGHTHVVGGALPFEHYHSITEEDPDDISPGQQGRRTLTQAELNADGIKYSPHIAPEHLERGYVTSKNIWKNRSKNWLSYVKNNPGRFATGVGMAALSYGLPAYQLASMVPTAKKLYHAVRGQTPIADAQAAERAAQPPVEAVKQACAHAFTNIRRSRIPQQG